MPSGKENNRVGMVMSVPGRHGVVSMSVQMPYGKENNRITVLIVDDDAQFRQLASELLADQGYEVVGWAGTVGEAIAEFDRLDPDAVLLDVRLPDGSGLALAERLCAASDRPKVVLTSSDRTAVRPEQIENSAATGFVPKTQLARTDLEPFLNRNAKRLR